VIVESLLGFRIEGGDTLVLTPRIPAAWPGFTLRYRHGDAAYTITVEHADDDAPSLTLDGERLAIEGASARIPLRADGRAHTVRLTLARASVPATADGYEPSIGPGASSNGRPRS
jgi:cyclic beta-1,2-glucan synthetase